MSTLLDIHSHLEEQPIRAGYGRGLLQAGKDNPEIVALCADLTESTAMNLFADEFPDRFVEIGIAEQNLVTVASGMAATGKIPFCSSYAAFSPGRNWEQIRTTACLNDQPVKIIGSHAGLSVGPDGATHQMLEDLAIMRVLPNMVVLAPCDAVEAEKAVAAMVAHPGPNYMRLAREATPVFTTDKTPFEIGKAQLFRVGKDITFVTTGTMTFETLMAADILAKDGIDAEVVHCPTIKPLDAMTILSSATKTGVVVTVEEAQIAGGLGGAVAELLGEHHPTIMKRIGMLDHFGESGSMEELWEHFKVDRKSIAKTTKDFLATLK